MTTISMTTMAVLLTAKFKMATPAPHLEEAPGVSWSLQREAVEMATISLLWESSAMIIITDLSMGVLPTA